MKKLLIDTDGGVDDALAILAALGSREAELVAITTVAGNVSLDQATRNVALIRRMFDPACAVPISAGRAAAGLGTSGRATEIHGQDGLGGISALRHDDGSPRYVWPEPSPAPLTAAEQIRAQCGRHGPELTLAFLGPLTNLAEAVRHYGGRTLNGARVVLMGGSFRAGRNRPRRADFNISADVEAARTVLNCGAMLDLVTLDVCERYILTRVFLERMTRRHPSAKARFIRDIHQRYMDYYHREVIRSVDGCYPHDTIAVTCALRPDLFSYDPRHVEVVSRVNGSFGHTLSRPGKPENVRVVMGFDPADFEDCLIRWVWT